MIWCIYIFTFIILCLTIYIIIPTHNKYQLYFKRNNPYPVISELQSKVLPVFKHYHVNVNVIFPSRDGSSYCYNKKLIFINIYKPNGNIYSMPDLVEICLHELAHIRCTDCLDVHTHSMKCYDKFNEIVDIALKLGVMDDKKCIFNQGCSIIT